jgi:transposase-like protein
MEAIEAEILDGGKRDGRGRKVLPTSEWKRLLAEYEKSGLTQKAFARREGINVHTFVAWLGRHRKAFRAKTDLPVQFREVSLPAAAIGPLEVQLPDGVVVRGSSPRALAELIRALRG